MTAVKQSHHGDEDTDLTPRIVNANRRANMVWLIGAISAFVAAVVITLMAKMGTQALDHATSVGIENEAVRIATAIDASARAAHLQADGIAATPVLRAAIGTDAATMADIFDDEVKFAPKTGEMLEIFQIRDNKPATLLRLPSTAAPLAPIAGRGSRLENTGKGGLDVIAGAPIAPQRDDKAGVTGQIALSVPVELAGARQRLSDVVVEATLLGAGAPVVLVETRGATDDAVSIAVQPNAEWGFGAMSLKVLPRRVEQRARWIDPVRYGSLGLGVMLLGLFLIGLRRR